VAELASLISQLPLANYSLLRALTAHLILIVQNSNVNKMTMRNVGIVFSPTLGIPAGVFSLMLNEFNRVFSVETEAVSTDAPAPAGSGSTPEGNLTVPLADAATSSLRGKRTTSDPSRRNSRSYNEAHADKLLGLAGRTLRGKCVILKSIFSLLIQIASQLMKNQMRVRTQLKTTTMNPRMRQIILVS
jgi:RalA-binding protein 1